MSKYLLYAIGEILLVVIGILIALNINNANETKNNEAKITSILKQMQTDLVTDIERSITIFDGFIWADSIQDLILNDKHTYEDYKNGLTRELVMYYSDFIIQTTGYENLMRNIDNVSEKHESLLNDVKHLYVSVNSNIDVYNARIRKTVYDNVNYWYKQPWVQKAIKGYITDEEIAYYLKSPKYKSMVGLYMNDLRNVFTQSQHFRLDAIDLYRKISEHLKSTDPIPEIVNYTSKDTTLLNEVIGTYKLNESVGSRFYENVRITNEGNELHLIGADGDKVKLVSHKESIFLIEGRSAYVYFNRTKKGELFISTNINGAATYIKTE